MADLQKELDEVEEQLHKLELMDSTYTQHYMELTRRRSYLLDEIRKEGEQCQ